MGYSVITGEQFDVDFIDKLYDIDEKCYSKEFVGDIEQMKARFMQNNKTFVCLMCDDNPVGYINFFPVTGKLWEDIVEESMDIRDDDIMPDELCDYSVDSLNYLYILSVVILPEHQGHREAVSTLTYGFIDYLSDLQCVGYSIKAISATTISDDGEKYISNLLFGFYREIHNGYKIWILDGAFLTKFMNKDLYFKTYKCDAYIKLTFSGRLDDLESTYRDSDYMKILTELNSGINSELYVYYQTTKLKRIRYVDSDELLSYKCEKNSLAEEKVYMFLANGEGNTCNALLVMPELSFSPTQLVRQVGEDNFDLWHEGDKNIIGLHMYSGFVESMERRRGIKVIDRKVLFCMSNAPEDEEELMNILHGIVYNGANSVRRKGCVRTNNVKAIAVVIDKFNDKEIGERVRHMVQYL